MGSLHGDMIIGEIVWIFADRISFSFCLQISGKEEFVLSVSQNAGDRRVIVIVA